MNSNRLQILSAAAFAVCIALSGSLQATPKLEIPEKVFDFGFVPQHSSISHRFWLHSIGTDTVRILKVVPG